MNVHDSENIAKLLELAGYEPGTETDYDIIVYNTCAVRENAKKRLYGLISQHKNYKKLHPEFKVVVAGCLAQNERDDLIKKTKTVDVVVGTYNIHAIPQLLQRSYNTGKPQIEILEEFPNNSDFSGLGSSNKHKAFVSISKGCNQKCSFCIVPFVRGKQINRPFEDIVAEAKNLVSTGVKEITLLGQNVNAYRNIGVTRPEIAASPMAPRNDGSVRHFGDLLNAVAQIQGLERVRFMSPHPGFFTKDVIGAIASNENIMPAIHFPMQSGSTRLLKEMNRGYTIEHYKKLVDTMRSKIPNLELTTDMITGFVGETDEDHKASLDALRYCEFLSVYSFIYSPRPGTKSLTMGQVLPKEVIQNRFEELLQVQKEITLNRMKNFENKTVKVMIDEAEGRKDSATNRITGRSEHNILVHFSSFLSTDNEEFLDSSISAKPFEPECKSPVLLTTPSPSVPPLPNEGEFSSVSSESLEKCVPGDVVSVRITKAAPYHLIGELVD
jgi:tRNA-2-methylthio-N6-dimethylallyladenosine synthase